jgi:predicted aldo/keto reductase-like oxidoreductase
MQHVLMSNGKVKKMLYRKLGKTGIELSNLGFGCMRLPVIDKKAEKIDYPKATELLHYAIDHGVNFVDTAYFYHSAVFGQKGESEVFLGEALSGEWRKKVYLATKMPLFHIRQREQMDALLKEQLERLKTDHLDFYLLHGLNGETWDKMRDLGVREFLDKMKAEGKIGFAAFSFHGNGEDFIKICDEFDWAYAQIQYNYMDIDFQAGRAGLNYASGKGMGVVVMEPLRGGKLAQNLPQEMTSVIESNEIKRSPAEWALRFVWNEPGVSNVLSGMNNMEQVVENIRVAGEVKVNSLCTNELAVFDKLLGVMETRKKADCTGCRYCMPCGSGVEIPDILAALNRAAIWNDPNPWLTGYTSIEGKASKCTECGNCERICPQGLGIVNFMKEAVLMFKE